ncbi:phage tail protein [Kluyvera ascorbata]|uniref:phage tail protein n=1 Tax=Kluyvera ascorbata TaxID=51288 RepID=UPI00205792D6|nr:phage tail protein [Kluyvera ascorbata]UPQ69683.1 phage tail protein [Kluyvera ascorbata]
MAQNDFKPFAIGAGANVTAQADWELLAALATGFQSGKASSAQINKAIRQASFIAAALAQYTSDKTGGDVLDDGDQAAFISKMAAAFGKDFQPLDATLTALAALTGVADKLAYFNGDDTAALTALTAVGRDIIGKSSIADVLTYLGLGNTKYGAPLIGQLIEWPLQKMPHEIWPDMGQEYIPYMAQSFDPVKYPLLSQLHPTNVLPADMRAYVARGWDNGRGVDTGRALMSAQSSGAPNLTGQVSNMGNILGVGTQGHALYAVSSGSGSTLKGGTDSSTFHIMLDASKDSTEYQAITEVRSKNVAWNMIVRAK